MTLKLNDEERALVEEAEACLTFHAPQDLELVRDCFGCLRALGKAISAYPPVRESPVIRRMTREGHSLAETLCAFRGSTRLLHIPSQVVMVRGYLVAKYQAFSLLFGLAGEPAAIGRWKPLLNPLRQTIFSIIYTLMTEEVYLSCLDDPDFSQEIKIRVADDLITLWDTGADPRLVRYLPALEALWTARDDSPPNFGTMDGSSELLRITMDLEEVWQRFLVDEGLTTEARQALEEFLFGLSYEEITAVRSRLTRFGIAAVDRDEVRTYLGGAPAYGPVSASDFRSIYNFWVDRRDAANFRKRTSAPGPWHTLEEIYLRYRIARE